MTKNTRHYESIIIVNSSLHEDTLNRIVSRCEEIITKNGGTILETERWGKRRLAYPIKKFQYGFYIIFHIDAPAELIADLEREYRLNENILRFMTLVKDKRAIEAYQQRKDAESEKVEQDTKTVETKDAAEESAQKSEDKTEDTEKTPEEAQKPEETLKTEKEPDESEVTGKKSTPETDEKNGDSPNDETENTPGGNDKVEENKSNND